MMVPFKRFRAPWLVGGSVLTVPRSVSEPSKGWASWPTRPSAPTPSSSTPVRSVTVSGDGVVHVRGYRRDVRHHRRHDQRGPVLAHPRRDRQRRPSVVSASCPALLNTWCGVSYTLHIPKALPVTIRSSGGGITVTGVDGDLDLSSSGGGIAVDGGSGHERLDSSGGRHQHRRDIRRRRSMLPQAAEGPSVVRGGPD